MGFQVGGPMSEEQFVWRVSAGPTMTSGHLHTLEEARSVAERWREEGWQDVIIERAVLFAWEVIDE
jgi:hypothetical protein